MARGRGSRSRHAAEFYAQPPVQYQQQQYAQPPFQYQHPQHNAQPQLQYAQHQQYAQPPIQYTQQQQQQQCAQPVQYAQQQHYAQPVQYAQQQQYAQPIQYAQQQHYAQPIQYAQQQQYAQPPSQPAQDPYNSYASSPRLNKRPKRARSQRTVATAPPPVLNVPRPRTPPQAAPANRRELPPGAARLLTQFCDAVAKSPPAEPSVPRPRATPQAAPTSRCELPPGALLLLKEYCESVAVPQCRGRGDRNAGAAGGCNAAQRDREGRNSRQRQPVEDHTGARSRGATTRSQPKDEGRQATVCERSRGHEHTAGGGAVYNPNMAGVGAAAWSASGGCMNQPVGAADYRGAQSQYGVYGAYGAYPEEDSFWNGGYESSDGYPIDGDDVCPNEGGYGSDGSYDPERHGFSLCNW